MFTLHALALGTVLTDGQNQHSKVAARNVQVRPIGAVQIAPGSAYDAAKADLNAGNLVQALEGFRRAVREAPQSVDALNGLAVVYDLLGRYDQSRAYYEAALAVDPAAAVVASNYGYSLYQQGDFAAARPLLEAAVKGDDAAARASSRNTLQMIARRAPAVVAVAEPVRPPERGSWIEQSTNGEQRLVLDAPVAAGSNPLEVALVAPAVEWTALDDVRADRRARVEFAAAEVAPEVTIESEIVTLPAELAGAETLAAPETAIPSQPAAPAGKAIVTAKSDVPDTDTTMARAQATVASLPIDRRAPRLIATSGYRLIAGVANTDPSRRRRGATVQVGGLELARQLVAIGPTATGETPTLGLDLLTTTLTRFGAPADDAIGYGGTSFDRLSAGLGMLVAAV